MTAVVIPRLSSSMSEVSELDKCLNVLLVDLVWFMVLLWNFTIVEANWIHIISNCLHHNSPFTNSVSPTVVSECIQFRRTINLQPQDKSGYRQGASIYMSKQLMVDREATIRLGCYWYYTSIIKLKNRNNKITLFFL